MGAGSHCHYEIRYNEEKTDPESYFTGLSYYDCQAQSTKSISKNLRLTHIIVR